MKDKLTKNNHKPSYFILRKSGIILAALIFLGGVIAIPTYINIKTTSQVTAGKAEETLVSESSEELPSLEETESK